MTVELGRPTRSYDPVSISPLSFWADSAEGRERSFKILRDERPVSWHRPIDGALMVPEIDPMVTTEFSRWDGSRT
jgi:hypothetical protein